jgi:hypothetical protein
MSSWSSIEVSHGGKHTAMSRSGFAEEVLMALTQPLELSTGRMRAAHKYGAY